MSEIKDMFFTTEVTIQSPRPATTVIQQRTLDLNSSDSSDAYQRMRRTKMEFAQAKKAHLSALQDFKLQKSSLQKINKTAHMKRVEFLKIYGNKKHKIMEKDLLDSSRKLEENRLIVSMEKTKRRKLEGELQLILAKNDAEEDNVRRQLKNRDEKQKIRSISRVKNLEIQEERKKQYMTVKKRELDFMIRKSTIATSMAQRAKENYIRKVNQELQTLKEFDNIMNEINEIMPEEEKAPNSTFITTANTFQY